MRRRDDPVPALESRLIVTAIFVAMFYALVPVVTHQMGGMGLRAVQALPVVIGASVITMTFFITAAISRFLLVRLLIGACIAYLIWGAGWFAWFVINRTMEDANAAVMSGPFVLLETLEVLSEKLVFRHRKDEVTGEALWAIWLFEAGGFSAAALFGALFGGWRMRGL